MKIKLVSGKEVENNSTVYWIDKGFCGVMWDVVAYHADILEEDEESSEIFATREEAEKWLENYKKQVFMEKNKDTEIISYDFINPSHYKNSSKEVIEMMEDIWGTKNLILHCEMTAFKYRMRLGLKPEQPIERDLEKARWYENKAKELKDKLQ